MYSQTTAINTRDVGGLSVQEYAGSLYADIPGARTLCVVDCSDTFQSKTVDRAERDRQASLELLHHLVMGAEGD